MITSRADHGGGPKHIYDLLRFHIEHGVEYFIACPKDYPYWSLYEEKVGSNRIHQIPHRKFEFTYLLSLIKFLRTKRIELIHAHGKGGGVYGRLASMLTKIPCVYTLHGIHVEHYGNIARKIYLLYESISSPFTKHLIFVSLSEKNFSQKLGLWKKTPYSVISNGVDSITADQIKVWRNKMRQRLVDRDDRCIVSTITRFDFPKNMYEAYEIAKIIPEFRFIWIGDGDDRQNLEKKAKSEGVNNIYFTGFVSNPLEHLAASDIYLSVSRWEGMPYGILEAMSVGLPVVASEVVGNIDIVRHGENGFLYPLGNYQEAQSYLKMIWTDRDLYQRLSVNSIQIQRREFSIENMAHRTFMLYRKVIND